MGGAAETNVTTLPAPSTTGSPAAASGAGYGAPSGDVRSARIDRN
jgi:hypothetical protein